MLKERVVWVVVVVVVVAIIRASFDWSVALDRTIFEFNIKPATAPVIKIADRTFVLLVFIVN